MKNHQRQFSCSAKEAGREIETTVAAWIGRPGPRQLRRPGYPDTQSGGTPGTASPTLAPATPAATQRVPAASATPAAAGLSSSQLKYRLIDHFGGMGEQGIFYCDPDLYPIAREGREEQQARDLLPTIQSDAELFGAISQRLGLGAGQAFSAEQQLRIYREYKQLDRIQLAPAGSGYSFSLPVTAYNGASNVNVAGEIAADGAITVSKQEAGGVFACPICLAQDTLIDTPAGPLAVQAIAVGTLVWTLDERGARVAAPVVATSRVPVPVTHRVVDLRLADGRRVLASPNHPTADGRQLGDLRIGASVDGSAVAGLDLRPYAAGATYDLLPAGPTGVYWADGVLLGSTLRQPAR
jgi:hypothetical protein